MSKREIFNFEDETGEEYTQVFLDDGYIEIEQSSRRDGENEILLTLEELEEIYIRAKHIKLTERD